MAQAFAAHRTEVSNSPLALNSTQLALEMMDCTPANTQLGFELGWDHAHHGLTPPVQYLFAGSPLRQGWLAGQASYGARTLKPTRHVRQWLNLRLHAWARGRAFEDVQITPNYLQQIDVSHCPITRQALDQVGQPGSQRSIDRVRDDAAYAAGNLVLMSRSANAAKNQHGFASALEVARSLARGPFERIAGLGATEWLRIATLCSYVTELPHEQAAALPLRVLPPNRLRLFNPIQALQALVTRQLARPGWSERLGQLEALLPNAEIKRDFNAFVLAMVPRLIPHMKAPTKANARRTPTEQAEQVQEGQVLRWALEDAWDIPLVQRRWTQFALALNAEQAESLVQRAARLGVSPMHVQQFDGSAATEGWALEQGGFQRAQVSGRTRQAKPMPAVKSNRAHRPIAAQCH